MLIVRKTIAGLLTVFVAIAAIVFFFATRGQSESQVFEQTLASVDAGRLSGLATAEKQLRQNPEWKDAAELLDAVVLLRGDRPESALRTLAALDQNGPLRHHILLYGGEALYRLGRFSEAARSLGVVVAEDKDNLPAHRWLSATFYDLGAFDAAIIELKHIIRLDPSDYRPHHLLSLMYHDFGQHAEVIDHCETALRLASPDEIAVEIRLRLVESRIALHEYEAALKILHQVPESGRSLLLGASCQWNLGHADSAQQILEKAKQSGEDSAALLLLESEILNQQGHSEQSVARLRDGIRRFPNDAELRYQLGLALKESGHDEEAAEQMAFWENKKALATRLTELNLIAIGAPYDAQVREELARVCEQLGRTELARMWAAAAESCRGEKPAPAPARTIQ